MSGTYLLPHHTTLTTLDPLDICGDYPEFLQGDGSVDQAWVLEVLLRRAEDDLTAIESIHDSPSATQPWARRFTELLKDIAYSLHGDGSLDAGFLTVLLAEQTQSQLQTFRTKLFASARALPSLCPTAILPFLNGETSQYSLTNVEADALLAHMILGTLQIPPGNSWGRPGFLAYYKSEPAIESTVRGYIVTLFRHFVRGGYAISAAATPFTFHYSTSASMPSPKHNQQSIAQLNINIVPEASDPSPSSHDPTFVLLSAHSQPGPGPSGTHEERLDGQSPVLAIASLLAPLLPPDAAVVSSALPVHAAWRGHNRDARLTELYEAEHRPMRGYIIADALELDLVGDGELLGDLRDDNVLREIRKLYAGFKGARKVRPDRQMRIEVYPWGCQSFGGSLVIKAQCIVIAGALAGIDTLELYVPEQRKGDVDCIMEVLRAKETVSTMFNRLASLRQPLPQLREH